MHLSPLELVRLELMLDSGQIQSDPTGISPNGKIEDFMIHNCHHFQDSLTVEQSVCEVAPAIRSQEHRSIKWKNEISPQDSIVVSGFKQVWNPAPMLIELIRIRRALLRDEKPDLLGF